MGLRMIQRLINFYKRSVSISGKVSDVWNGILQSLTKPLIDALMREDGAAIQDIFDDPQKATQIMHGLDATIMYYWGKEITTGDFPNLARRIGVIPTQHPWNPSPDENWNPKDGIELKKKVEEVLGPIRVPNGFLVKDSSLGIPYTYFSKLSQWFTVSSLIKPAPKRVLEIGAGCGGFALAAFNNGVRDYTIIDIPAIAVQSAYYLSKAFGEDRIWLDGEPPNSTAICRWFSCHAYGGAKSEYDLIANINSFPEMDIEQRDEYMRFIHECLSSNGMFYSCNHESNMVLAGTIQDSVISSVKRHGGFKMIYRAPSMIRVGYMEEIFQRK